MTIAHLEADKFESGTILDEAVQTSLSIPELHALLEEYADNHGTQLHHYPRGTLPSPTPRHEWGDLSEATLLEALYSETAHYVLLEQALTDDGVTAETQAFVAQANELRVNVLAWANPSSELSGSFGLELPADSKVEPDRLADIILSMSDVRFGVEDSLARALTQRIKVNNNARKQLEATIQDLAGDAANLVRMKSQVEELLEQINFATTLPKYDTAHKSRSFWFYRTPNGVAVHTDLWPMSTSALENFVSDPAAGFDATAAAFPTAHSVFRSRVVQNFGDVPDWYLTPSANFRFRAVFEQFLDLFLSQLNARIDEQGTVDPQSLARLEAHHTRQLALTSLLADANSGSLYEDWTQWLVTRLSSGHRIRFVVPGDDHLLQLVERMDMSGQQQRGHMMLAPASAGSVGEALAGHARLGLLGQHQLVVHHRGFGAGRHLYSQSLFPGEQVEAKVRSLSRETSKVSTTSAEKIFEEADEGTTQDFSRELGNQSNNSVQRNEAESHKVSAELGVSVAAVVDLKTSYGYSWSASEESKDVVQSVEKTLDKLASRISSKRRVQFEQTVSTEAEQLFEEETTSTRKFRNINDERTLTFNFFEINREVRTVLRLDDLRLYYTSGRQHPTHVFINDSDAWEETSDDLLLPDAERLPIQLSQRFSPSAAITILAPAYRLLLPLSAANAFLAATFDESTALAIGSDVWRWLGDLPARPGHGVAAFPLPKQHAPSWPDVGGSPAPTVSIDGFDVLADTVTVGARMVLLPNIDLRYKPAPGRARGYFDTENSNNSVPRTLWHKDYTVATNGVYAENMLGRCLALEEYSTEHRRLDVELKGHEVALRRRLLPPDTTAFTSESGELDEERYDKAVERHLRLHAAHSTATVDIDAPQGTTVHLNDRGEED